MTGHSDKALPAVGALSLPDGATLFRVWAPRPRTIELCLHDHAGHEVERVVQLDTVGQGYFEARVSGLNPGARYSYRLNGAMERPDPASRWQPDGVHRPSAVTRATFQWTDALWRGRPWSQYVIYELHVGTFSAEGTFDGVISSLDELADLGITALQLMPVVQVPGTRNWGYDGVHPFAVQNSYGGSDGLRRLVDACHGRGLAVILDLVYNHLGPEGNYLAEFGPYFTDRYRTPWGQAINFDGRQSEHVRSYFIQNALMWVREYHVDGFRLDATHAIHDQSPRHFLDELTADLHAAGQTLGRQIHVVAENNANDPRLVLSHEAGGYALDAQLDDDFQRSLHALLTGEHSGYYADFGRLADFAKAYQAGFALTGQFSQYRGGPWGVAAAGIRADRFVAYAQCHDSVGNRPGSERLGRLVDFESLKLAAAAVILSPAIPLLFMGEEYDDPAPFNYFTSHLDPRLADAVRRGRIREFARFHWSSEPPDPQAAESFAASRLNRALAAGGQHAVLLDFYRQLLRLRQSLPAVREAERSASAMHCDEATGLMVVRRWTADSVVCIALNFGRTVARLPGELHEVVSALTVRLDSSETAWGGTHAGQSAVSPALLEVRPRSCLVLTH